MTLLARMLIQFGSQRKEAHHGLALCSTDRGAAENFAWRSPVGARKEEKSELSG
jgi:hypothetical protein